MSKPSKLASPKSPHVQHALRNHCPVCNAQSGEHSHRITRDAKGNRTGQAPLVGRIVHYGRSAWKTEPSL